MEVTYVLHFWAAEDTTMDAFLMVWMAQDMELTMSQEEQTIQIWQEVKSESNDKILMSTFKHIKYNKNLKKYVYTISIKYTSKINPFLFLFV